GAERGDTGRLALSSVGRESSPVLRTGIEPRCGSRPPCVLANHPVSPLPAILPRPAGQLGPCRQSPPGQLALRRRKRSTMASICDEFLPARPALCRAHAGEVA